MAEEKEVKALTPEFITANECKSKGTWIIYFGPGPDDWTEACTLHVGELLQSGENKVLPTEEPNAECCFIGGQDAPSIEVTE